MAITLVRYLIDELEFVGCQKGDHYEKNNRFSINTCNVLDFFGVM